MPLAGTEGEHEVDRVFRLARAFGVEGPPPPLRIAVDATDAGRVRAALVASGITTAPIGIHLSARKPSQRWPADRFVALMRALA